MSAQTLLGAYGTEGEPSRLPLDLELAEANLRSRGVNGLLAALLRLNFMYIKRMCCLELHSHLGISVNCLFTPHRPFFRSSNPRVSLLHFLQHLSSERQSKTQTHRGWKKPGACPSALQSGIQTEETVHRDVTSSLILPLGTMWFYYQSSSQPN